MSYKACKFGKSEKLPAIKSEVPGPNNYDTNNFTKVKSNWKFPTVNPTVGNTEKLVFNPHPYPGPQYMPAEPGIKSSPKWTMGDKSKSYVELTMPKGKYPNFKTQFQQGNNAEKFRQFKKSGHYIAKEDSPRRQNENPGPGDYTNVYTPRKTYSPTFSLGYSERPCLMKEKVTGSSLDYDAHVNKIKQCESGSLSVKIPLAKTSRQDLINKTKLPGPGSYNGFFKNKTGQMEDFERQNPKSNRSKDKTATKKD